MYKVELLYRLVIPDGPETILSRQAGDSFIAAPGNGAPTVYIVWRKAVTINNNQWHMYIAGYEGTLKWDGLNYLSDKSSALTEGAFYAAHPIAGKELVLMVLQELDRDMLIALDAQSGDALFPASLPVLAALLESISIAE